MQPRRRREASTLSDWPRLSLLAVYRDTPVLDEADTGVKLDDAALEAAKVLFLASPGSEDALDSARKGRAMGTVTGVAAFARALAPDGQGTVRSVQANKRRMLWVEPERGYHVHATIALPRTSRHSRRASAATNSSSASTSTPAFSLDDDVLLVDMQHAYREYRLRYGKLATTLELEGKTHLKERLEGFWQDWAERWDVTGAVTPSPVQRVLDAVPRCSLLTPSSSPQLLPLLAQFAASNPSVLPILLHDSTVLSLPDLFSARTFPRTDHTSPPPLSDEDLLALVRYLHRLLPSRRSLSVQASTRGASDEQGNPAAASSSAADDDAASSWTAPFSSLANGMTSFLAPRPMSFSLSTSPPPPATPAQASAAAQDKDKDVRGKSLRAGFAALRRSEKDAVAERQREQANAARAGRRDGEAPAETGGGGGWSFRSVSGGWSKLGFGAAPAKAVKADAEAAAGDAVKRDAGAASPEDHDDVSAALRAVDDGEPMVSALEPTAELAADQAKQARSEPTTPAVELAPSVDAGELAEAMGASPAQERSEAEVVPQGATEAREDAGAPAEVDAPLSDERELTLELMCGGDDENERETRFHLKRYERGALTLGLAMLPKTDTAALAWLDSRAERLLEAVESLLEVVQPPTPPYPQRHYVKRGPFVSSFSPSSTPEDVPAAADGSSAQDDELTTSAALLDAYRSLHSTPPVLESLTRLAIPSAPWIVHRRADAPSTSAAAAETTDVYAVLSSVAGSGTGGARGKGKAKAGGEVSLVDAADEVRRLLSAYGRV